MVEKKPVHGLYVEGAERTKDIHFELQLLAHYFARLHLPRRLLPCLSCFVAEMWGEGVGFILIDLVMTRIPIKHTLLISIILI